MVDQRTKVCTGTVGQNLNDLCLFIKPVVYRQSEVTSWATFESFESSLDHKSMIDKKT